jgi:hypothetical protein
MSEEKGTAKEEKKGPFTVNRLPKVLPVVVKSLSLRGYSVWTLLAANIGALAVALIEGWSLAMLMTVYIGQSLIIGFIRFVRILTLKQFDLSEIEINDRPVESTVQGKIKVAAFFLFFYCFIHGVYLFIFMVEGSISQVLAELDMILVSLAFFFAHHVFSLFYNIQKDSKKKKSVGHLLGTPFFRIFPIHLTIVFGFVFMAGGPWLAWIAYLIFVPLKIVIDIFMHLLEHVDPYTWLKIADQIEADDPMLAKNLRELAKALLKEIEEYKPAEPEGDPEPYK